MTPCPACDRHVRESPCPFCGAAVEIMAMPEPRGRLKRAAIMAFGATLVAACGDKGGGGAKNPTTDADAGTQIEDQQERHHGGGGNNMPYGAPPADGLIKRIV